MKAGCSKAPALDGEAYFATALYFAAGRWGNGRGIFHYRAQAARLLTDLRHRQILTGPTIKGPMTAGAIFEPDLKMIRFTPDVDHWNHTDPSPHVPAFHTIGSRWGPEGDRESWGATPPRARQFVEAFWNTPIPAGQHRYYDGMLSLLGLLHCSGEFKIWPPR